MSAFQTYDIVKTVVFILSLIALALIFLRLFGSYEVAR